MLEDCQFNGWLRSEYAIVLLFIIRQVLIDMNYPKVHKKGKPIKGPTHDHINFYFRQGESLSRGSPLVNQEGFPPHVS